MWPSFKTAFPKYPSDRQADGDGCEGAGGEWIRNKPEDASVSTTSIGGRVGWAPLPMAPRIAPPALETGWAGDPSLWLQGYRP